MLQAVIQQNSIIYLPTGAGKTFIAFMTMKHYYPQIEKYAYKPQLAARINLKSFLRPFAAGGKRIVFAAPKVAIVTQQYNVLSRQTQFSVGLFNGNMNVDNWTKDMWESQIDLHSVSCLIINLISNFNFLYSRYLLWVARFSWIFWTKII
jgi:endoribonuclease Dicer